MRKYINDQEQEAVLPANWNQMIDPRSQAVEPTDDIETVMLAGGLANAGLKRLPNMSKMLGLAEGPAPSLVANEVGAVGKNVAPLIEEQQAKAAMNKAFTPKDPEAAYALSKDAIKKQQQFNRLLDFMDRKKAQGVR